jgi:flagellar motor switch protein FliG
MIYKILHRKQKIEQHESYTQKAGMNSGALGEQELISLLEHLSSLWEQELITLLEHLSSLGEQELITLLEHLSSRAEQ